MAFFVIEWLWHSVSQHHHQAEEGGQSATDADDPVKPLGPLFERDAEVEQKCPPPQCQQQRNIFRMVKK